ncbi:hypothetical protein KIPB_008112, partial [Kipferlia bialata]|eukprot:g4513.t1
MDKHQHTGIQSYMGNRIAPWMENALVRMVSYAHEDIE